MQNKVFLVNEVDYMFEAWQLLQFLASSEEHEEQYEKFKKAILEKFGVDSEHVRACIAFGEKGIKAAKEVFAGREEEIRTYFAPIENEIIPADLVLSWGDWAGDDSVTVQSEADMRAYYEAMSEEMRDASFVKELAHDMEVAEFDQIVGCEERGTSIAKAERMHNIFSYIQGLELKAESKMRIQDVYLNRDAYLEPICRLYQDAVDLLHTAEDEIKAICEEWAEYWGSIVESNSFLDTLKGIVEADETVLDKGIYIKPSVVQSGCVYINAYGGLIPSRRNYKTTCILGAIMTRGFDWNSKVQEEYQWESMQPIFKALGDKSKADILLFIKDKPAYGSEIAKQFSLTTATVSHHMNKLLQLRIIHAEMQDGKVYYQVRKDELAKMFEYCKRLFE